MPLFFGPGNNSFARCIKNCNINKHNDNILPLPNITTTGSPIITNYPNNYVSYTFPVGIGTFITNTNMTINFLIVGGGASGESNNFGLTSCGGGSGGIMQGTIDMSVNIPIIAIAGSGGGPIGDGIGINGNTSGIVNGANFGQQIIAGHGSFGAFPSQSNGNTYSAAATIILDAPGLPGAASPGTAVPGYPGQNGQNISLYGGYTTILCSSSGGGGAGGVGNNGGLGGTGAGNGGNGSFDASGNGTSATSYGSGGGGGGSPSASVSYNLYGAGADGVVIIYFQHPTIPIYNITCPPYKCPEPINSKVLNSNADVDQTLTQTNRVVNAIRTSPGGTIQFGNSATTGTLNRTQYLGRYEGQPGGIGRLSGKNKF